LPINDINGNIKIYNNDINGLKITIYANIDNANNGIFGIQKYLNLPIFILSIDTILSFIKSSILYKIFC
jgi:hypothetical protein